MSGQAVEFFELDVPYCSLTYGVAPCRAFLAGGFNLVSVRFDSTNRLTRGAGLSGAVDSKLLTFSIWINIQDNDPGGNIVTALTTVGGGVERARITTNAAHRVTLILQNAANTTILNVRTSPLTTGRLHHVFGAIDLADTAKRFLIVDGVPDLDVVTYTNDTADFTYSDWAVGAAANGAAAMLGALGEVWFAPGVYEPNVLKFRAANGVPVSLGSTGQTPTGTAPLLFLSGDISDWHTNKGTGGGLTKTGTLSQVSGGAAKCFQALATCQDTPNFTPVPTTLRFAKPAAYLPREIDIVAPCITALDFSPGTISLAETIGSRSVLKVSMNDSPHSDAGLGLDKYQAERGYDPFERGSFWPRFRARYPSITGFECRWVIGFADQALAAMETRTFFAEGYDGPSANGVFAISAKDALKFLDGDRAQAPQLSNGALSADITATATQITLTPAGVGAEYPATGYVRLSGNEDSLFYRDASVGNDANTLLLIHFEGADGATTFTDSSSFARSITRNGNAVVDDAQSFFPLLPSGLFDGSGDDVQAPDSNDWNFGTNLFTIEARIRAIDLASNRTVVGHGTDASNHFILFVNSTGQLTAQVFIGGTAVVQMPSAVGSIQVNTNYHIAVARTAGNVWRLFINGVQFSQQTASITFPNYTSAMRIGTDWNLGQGFNGWIGEVRISNVARWSSTFTPPSVPYQSSGDAMTLVRGRLGTTAATHSAGDRAQLAVNYAGMDPADIIYNHITAYTDLAAAYITLADWKAETAAFLGSLYTFTIGEPTSVAAFLGKVIEQAGLCLWDDAIAKQLRLKVIRAVAVNADVINEAMVVNNTFEITDQPDQRVSRAWIYYAIKDPTKNKDALDNYSASVRAPDDAVAVANESVYGAPAIKKIFADGIVQGGAAISTRLGNLLVGRKQRPPRRFKFAQVRGQAIEPVLGGGFYLDWKSLQDATGARETVPVQIIKLKPGPVLLAAEAEEMRFTNLDAASSNDRVILLNIDDYQLNLRAIHDQLYPATFGAGITVTFVISAHLGSKITTSPAVDTGTWPAGFKPLIKLPGRIQARGGLGGNGNTSGPLEDGQPGGVALKVRSAINLEFTGRLDGGGGGGGSGAGSHGGGGGAGFDPGLGGNGDGGNGKPGTTEAGGFGHNRGFNPHGGDGGDCGQAGKAGSLLDGSALHPGGAAGRAIDGVSLVTFTINTGVIRGPTGG